mgnify:CR=1 FL=1
MDRIKTFAKYAIWIILFWIFSDILINVGINTTYKDVQAKEAIPQGIEIQQMQATKVNGRMRIAVRDQSLSGKYLKISLYSDIGNELGVEYLEIGDLKENEIKSIEKYFKIVDVKSYEVSVVDEKGESSEGFMDTAMSAITIIMTVLKILAL